MLKNPFKKKKTESKFQYTKDPNGLVPDHMLKEDTFMFKIADGMFSCEELDLHCVANIETHIIIKLPNGITFMQRNTDNCRHFSWLNKGQVAQLIAHGAFDPQAEWNPNADA